MCRPAFLEEFERLEVELQQLYQDYLVRFRCVAYLEQQQEEAEQAEHERMEARKVTSLFFEGGGDIIQCIRLVLTNKPPSGDT